MTRLSTEERAIEEASCRMNGCQAADLWNDILAARRALRDLTDALDAVRFTQDHSEFTAEDRIKYAKAAAAARALVSENPKEGK